MKDATVLVLTDDPQFAEVLSSCWRVERNAPAITVLNSALWKAQNDRPFDLVIVGPMGQNIVPAILSSFNPGAAVILCSLLDSTEIHQLRARFPRLLHVFLREDWLQTLIPLAGESLQRVRAGRQAKHALSLALQSEREAVLGRYMADMKHAVNNALTSILGNAELLLLEPGQMSAQSLQQIKTMHNMTLRIHEIMQRFSSLASEMRHAENASQAETEVASPTVSTRN